MPNDPDNQCYHIPRKPDGGLDHCLFVFYFGCDTAAGQQNSPLMSQTLAKGADVVAGFQEHVGGEQRQRYLEVFFDHTELQGQTLGQAHTTAIDALIDEFDGNTWGHESFWTSNSGLRTRPARFSE